MPDIPKSDATKPAPPCPLCGGAMRLAQTHRVKASTTDIFQCRVCGLQYPVVTGHQDKP